MASETVSKTKGTAGEAPAKRKTITNWRVLTEGHFVPVRFRCDAYLGTHPAELTCHTNIHPTAENVMRHMHPDHGLGTFKVKFRISEGKSHALWQELEDAGVEIQHLYCPHCRQDIDLMPRQLIAHLQSHQGANRVNLDPQTLCFTLSFNKPEGAEMDSLYETEID